MQPFKEWHSLALCASYVALGCEVEMSQKNRVCVRTSTTKATIIATHIACRSDERINNVALVECLCYCIFAKMA